jgi:peptidyl-prolyl cis-trans isomerase C
MMTLKTSHFWMVLAAFAAVPACAQNLVIVNGTPIPQARADAIISRLAKEGQKDAPQLRQAVRDELIKREILMQEANREGIPTHADVQAEIADTQQTIVINALLENYIQNNKPTDKQMQARYAELVKQADSHEYHVRHILVDNEQQAEGLTRKIKTGGNFEDLAKQYSKDPGSAKSGGDLGWAKLGTYVPEFSAAVKTLPKGRITDTPVRTSFGWHIIRVDDLRDVAPPSLAQMKPQIVEQLQREKLREFEESLRKQAKIQ